jgi:hypothetical protein
MRGPHEDELGLGESQSFSERKTHNEHYQSDSEHGGHLNRLLYQTRNI